MAITFLFPHQLNARHPIIDENKRIYLIESHRHFTDFAFHKQKLVLHHASMHAFADELRKKGKQVTIIPFSSYKKMDELIKLAKGKRIDYITTTDHTLEKQLQRAAKKQTTPLRKYQTTNFFLDEEVVLQDLKEQENLFLFAFYKKQRIRFDYLMEGDKPKGGKWSYDSENRKKAPEKLSLPPP